MSLAINKLFKAIHPSHGWLRISHLTLEVRQHDRHHIVLNVQCGTTDKKQIKRGKKQCVYPTMVFSWTFCLGTGKCDLLGPAVAFARGLSTSASLSTSSASPISLVYAIDFYRQSFASRIQIRSRPFCLALKNTLAMEEGIATIGAQGRPVQLNPPNIRFLPETDPGP